MIIKRRYTKHFVTLENNLVRDRNLSLDEHGMLHYLLSLPDDWEVSQAQCARFWRIGRDKCNRIFRSLARQGWAQKETLRSEEDGKILGVRWFISDEPGEGTSDEAILDETSETADSESPSPENPTSGEPLSENPATANPLPGNPSPENPATAIYKDSKKTDSEENRLPQRGAGEKSIEISGTAPASFDDLVGLWPTENILSRTAAEQAWQRLGKVQRQHAFKVAPRYLGDCSHNSRKVCDLTTYLREERFERFVASPQRGASVLAKVGTPQWHRWREYRLATNQLVKLMDHQAARGIGWTVPTEWPPALPPKDGRPAGADTTGPPATELTEEDLESLR